MLMKERENELKTAAGKMVHAQLEPYAMVQRKKVPMEAKDL